LEIEIIFVQSPGNLFLESAKMDEAEAVSKRSVEYYLSKAKELNSHKINP